MPTVKNRSAQPLTGDIPLSVVLALDTSGSMAGLSIDQAKQAASLVGGQPSVSKTTASLLSFSDTVAVGPRCFRSTERRWRSLSRTFLLVGNTALYDATTAAADLAASSWWGAQRQ